MAPKSTILFSDFLAVGASHFSHNEMQAGQISSRPHEPTWAPLKVAFRKGNPPLYQKNVGWWNIRIWASKDVHAKTARIFAGICSIYSPVLGCLLLVVGAGVQLDY